MIVALFDADGTLYTAHFGVELTKHLNKQGRRWYGWRYFASVYPLYFLGKARLIPMETVQRAILSGLSGLMQNCTEQSALEAYDWMMDNVILPSQREDVVARLREHQAKGHQIVFVSGMIRPALELLMSHLGANDCIGTEPEIRSGRYTGHTIPPVVTGADKAIKVRALFEMRGVDVDWAASYAYGDSFTDWQMLSLVGHPVAVYPDHKLLALAQGKQWDVFGTPKER